MRPHDGDVALACAGLLVDELARAEIAGACVAAGSRSTPLALALARHPRLRVHVHLDERSAGFFALGLAKASRRPAAVLCTSGTAAANLLPAVVEASHACVPLVVLTADRPPELRGTGANQTIDQLKLFGDYPRSFIETGVPDTHEGAARYWRSLGARAAAAAVGPPAGPVHLNVPFREPLAPAGSVVDLGPEAAGRPAGAPWERVVVAQALPDPQEVGELAAILGDVERGVIVAGALDGDAPSVLDLAAKARWPLLAEAISGLRRPPHALAAAQHLLSDDVFAAEHRADVVLQIGAPPIGRAAQAFVASARSLIRLDPDGRFPDPARAAAWTIRADPDALAQVLLQRLRPSGGSSWLDSWREADRHARDAVDGLLDSWETPFEGRLARDLALALPGGSTLVVSSSMPVRDLDTFAAPRESVRVLANRGANGIDGFVSTVLGVAASGAPTYALAGDLSLFHDVGGLVWGARRERAVIVVPNNDGGGIFDLLPQAALPEHEWLFVTPHGLDLGALSRAAGASFERVARASDLGPAVARGGEQPGVTIVEVPIDRVLAGERRRAIRAAVREALLTNSPARERVARR